MSAEWGCYLSWSSLRNSNNSIAELCGMGGILRGIRRAFLVRAKKTRNFNCDYVKFWSPENMQIVKNRDLCHHFD